MTTATAAADPIVNPGLTEALWGWLRDGDRLDRFAAEVLGEARMIDVQDLADWAEDAIREDVDDGPAGLVLLQACRLADWPELTGRAEEALEV